LKSILDREGRVWLASAPEGLDARRLGEALANLEGATLLHIARDDARMARFAETLRFFHPAIEILTLPAWDCLPFDRASPDSALVGQRMATLARLAEGAPPPPGGRVVVTTVNAVLQRLPPRSAMAGARRRLRRGERIAREALVAFLDAGGYARTGTVMEPGEFAPRGGLVDVFPPDAAEPVRIDLFGDEIESLRRFDPVTQRSGAAIEEVAIGPAGEVRLDPASVERFRAGYRELFGADVRDDPLYEAVCAGRRYPGIEHWIALFYERLETLGDYLPGVPISLDPLVDEAREGRLATIADHYAARIEGLGGGKEIAAALYRPVPPERTYLDAAGWEALLAGRAVVEITPFAVAPTPDRPAIDAGGRPARDFAEARADPSVNLFDAVAAGLDEEARRGRRVLIACYSAGSRDRIADLLADHGARALATVERWAEAVALPAGTVALTVLGVDRGFACADLALFTEQDLLGERITRRTRPRRRASEAFIAEAASLSPGDLVVHADHGIGRFDGLETLSLDGAPHDCLRLIYAGGDKLYLPVENIELLSRYGPADGEVALDRLGSAHWQARRARLKERIREMAGELVRVAAERNLRKAVVLTPPEGLYDEFCARFPYEETEDQRRAIEDVLDDLVSGRPMDRLVCGDVGFGKTEVALRAAFVAAMNGRQVAVVVPTTLLCRQHFATFTERFRGLPVRIEQLSRLVPPKRAAEVRAGLASGQVDIVIGTHALLGKSIRFKDLGLLVVDEEQHFGVAHKERLKQLRTDVHVLTLTATPIPRTLQLALSGVRALSLITTPPVDRLAVRTFIAPFDPVVVREAILRERLRGGQAFYVCPRIEDIERLVERLRELVPEVRVAAAHGRLSARALERIMSAFYDGAYDVLVSTAIIESGLDIPRVNTLIVHRAHMFGLAQLYQLRGRIGRAKLRAYAYLTLPPRGGLTEAATKRLEVMHKLDSLGAGFNLASYDLDIRGAGNLLGAEQSGHIREVGLELYQQMLEDAVNELRAKRAGEGEEKARPSAERGWTPQINLGGAVLIPEDYVADLGLRLALYRRLGALESAADIDAFAAELVDRFGPLPASVSHLLRIVRIKQLCRAAGVARLDAGAEGAVIAFHDDSFANPAGLVAYIGREAASVRLRPDHRLVVKRDWQSMEARLAGVEEILARLSEIAREAA